MKSLLSKNNKSTAAFWFGLWVMATVIQTSTAYTKGRIKGNRRRLNDNIFNVPSTAAVEVFAKKGCKKELSKKESLLSKKEDPLRRLQLAKKVDDDSDDENDEEEECVEKDKDPKDPKDPKDDDLTDPERCNLIINGDSDTDGNSLSVDIDMLLAIDGDKSDILDSLEEFLQAQLGIDLARACVNRRYLVSATIENLDVSVFEDSTADCTVVTEGTCLGIDILLDLIYSGDDPSALPDQVRTSLLSFCDDIENINGVLNTFDPCPYILVDGEPLSSIPVATPTAIPTASTPSTTVATTVSSTASASAPTSISSTTAAVADGENNNGGDTGDESDVTDEELSTGNDEDDEGDGFTAATTERTSQRQGLSWAGAIIVAMGALLFCLLGIATFQKHRRDTAPLRHKALDDDGVYVEEETYLRDDESDHSWYPSTPRRTHVVGEDNSVASGWTGYTGARSTTNRQRGLYESDHDVHQCSSATCDVCELRRQAGLQFIPTGMPGSGNDSIAETASRFSSIPESATRNYSIPEAMDTVTF